MPVNSPPGVVRTSGHDFGQQVPSGSVLFAYAFRRIPAWVFNAQGDTGLGQRCRPIPATHTDGINGHRVVFLFVPAVKIKAHFAYVNDNAFPRRIRQNHLEWQYHLAFVIGKPGVNIRIRRSDHVVSQPIACGDIDQRLFS